MTSLRQLEDLSERTGHDFTTRTGVALDSLSCPMGSHVEGADILQQIACGLGWL